MNALILAIALLGQSQWFAPVGGQLRLKFSGQSGAQCSTPQGNCSVLSAVAANASSASRTFTLPVVGYSKVKIVLNFTYSAASAEVLTCYDSLDNGSSYAQVVSTSISSGVGTVSPYTNNMATSANLNTSLVYDVSGDDKFQCVWSATGGGASDIVTVKAVAYLQ